jgi:hypothetical protein
MAAFRTGVLENKETWMDEVSWEDSALDVHSLFSQAHPKL